MTLGRFLFIDSEMFGHHSFDIDTAFATLSDTPTQNLGVLVQATTQGLLNTGKILGKFFMPQAR